LSAASREKTVAALYRDRLAELRQELSSGETEAGDSRIIEEELSAALLADYDSDQDSVQYSEDSEEAHTQPGRGILLTGVVGLLAISLLVYSVVGDPAAMNLAGAESVLQLDAARDEALLSEWRERLSDRVDARTGDAKSWYLLGHVDLKLARYTTAAEAFAMAHAAHGDDPSIDIFWLQARYLAAGGQIDSTTRGIAERVLAGNPSQPLVLEMYAIDAYRQGAFQESVSLLNRALSGSLEATHRSSLEAGYQEARKNLGDLTPAVDVEIASAARVPPGTTMFVIARPIGGGMPYAVVRRPAGTFPLTVRLDDAVSMNPAAPLSSVGEVEIVVRISQAGTAMAHPGDWEWRSPPITLSGVIEPLSLNATLAPPAP